MAFVAEKRADESYDDYNRRCATESFNRTLRDEKVWPSGRKIKDIPCNYGCPASDHDAQGHCFRDCERCPESCWL